MPFHKKSVESAPASPSMPRVSAQIIQDTSDIYEITFRYPRIRGLSEGSMQEAVNTDIKNKAESIVNDFKTHALKAASADSSSKSSLDDSYEVPLLTPRLASFRLIVAEYAAGAAHPNDYNVVLNYNLTTGKRIALKDLFTPGSDYLRVLSRYAIKDLTTQLNASGDEAALRWIKDGASPQTGPFKSVGISKNALIIYFDSYQVAAYAAGLPKVAVPFTAIRNVINPAGPLKPFLNE